MSEVQAAIKYYDEHHELPYAFIVMDALKCLLGSRTTTAGAVNAPESSPTELSSTAPLTDDIELTIMDVMLELGVPVRLAGYKYLVEALMMCVSGTDVSQSITKVIYPAIAKKFSVASPNRVERGIRHAIEATWERGNLVYLEKVFGYTISPKKGKPTNGEFIAMVAHKISVDKRRKL